MNSDLNPRLDLEVNFGGNQRWYTRRYRPTSEAQVIELLERHSEGSIRIVGSRHSWSGIAADADVTLDMRMLDNIEPITINGEHFVRVGAGCLLKGLLAQLHSRTDRTLPTLGAVLRQTVSGAISTGTHGSGRQSLSHFVARIRAAVFSTETGRPEIREFTGGPELLAARCGLGCMGVILSVDLPTIPKFKIAETAQVHATIEDILRIYADRPLTQFVWFPYGWTWVAFERAPVPHPQQSSVSTFKTWFFRAYNLLWLDIIFHLCVHGVRLAGNRATKAYFKLAPRLLLKDIERIDEAHRVLTLRHHYFRHEEMEMFVKQSDIANAAEFLRITTEVFAGSEIRLSSEFKEQLKQIDCVDELRGLRGSYTHHYPLFFRRVLPEQALISMAASAEEPLFSISIFTYCPARKREAYYAFCGFLAKALLKLFKARLHWGKHFPLDYADIAPLYPRLEEFRHLCRVADPRGVLRNKYTARVLALSWASQSETNGAVRT